VGSRAAVQKLGSRVGLAQFHLLFPSLLAVRIPVTCKPKKTQQMAVDFNLFLPLFFGFASPFRSADPSLVYVFIFFASGVWRLPGGTAVYGLLLDGLQSGWWQRRLAFAAAVRLRRERLVCVRRGGGREDLLAEAERNVVAGCCGLFENGGCRCGAALDYGEAGSARRG
jgi:hypothetical protein